MEKSLKSSSINYGVYLGLILSTFTILGYVMIDLMTKWWYGILILIVMIVLGIMASMKARKLLGGFISFKNAFTAYFITVLIGLLIASLLSFILYNVVDPEAAALIQDNAIETQVKMLENFGTPQDVIDQTVQKMRESGNMYSIGNLLQSLVFQLVGFSIVGLIVAAVVKRKDPHAA